MDIVFVVFSLVLDKRLVHERCGSNSIPSLNGQLYYPADLDRPLRETIVDKILQYRADYNNRPSNVISFIPPVASTSDLLHCEFVHLLFLYPHPETDRFFAASGVQPVQTKHFHYRRSVFSSQIKSKVGHVLSKSADLSINLNIDDCHGDVDRGRVARVYGTDR